MIDNLYIDGMSARWRFGCWVTRGGYDGLLSLPAMREPEENDWPEEDGVEVDLSDPRLEPREIPVTFLADTVTGATDLVAYLSTPGYHLFRIPSLGREWRLRLSDHPANRVYPSATSFTLRLGEDVPERPEPGGPPDPGVRMPESRFRLDGVPLSAYGVVVDESRSDLLRAPQAKVNLDRTVSTSDGRIYDADHLVFQKREITLGCHFKAASAGEFWRCRDAFLAALTRPGERRLLAGEIGRELPCYYRETKGVRLSRLSAPVIVRFDLVLVITSFRLYETDYLLVTEEGDWIVTEDGEYCIDMG